MKNKITVIKLKFDISTIDFEQLNKTNESIISIETSETYSLAKTSNFTCFPPKEKSSLTELGNYSFLSVKKIPNEEKHDSLIKNFLL